MNPTDTFVHLDHSLGDFHRRLADLHAVLLEARVLRIDTNVLDAFDELTDELVTAVSQASLAAARRGRGSQLFDPAQARQSLAGVHQLVNTTAQRFYLDLLGSDRLDGLLSSARARGGDGHAWTVRVRTALHDCRPALHSSLAAIQACWAALTGGAEGSMPFDEPAAPASPAAARQPDRGQSSRAKAGGAIAGIYAGVESLLEEALELLNRLEPLQTEPLTPEGSAQAVDEVRAVVRTELNELIKEINRMDGPRVVRVDALFQAVLGADNQTGFLGALDEVFGLARENQQPAPLDHLDQRQVFHNLRKLLVNLRQTWQTLAVQGKEDADRLQASLNQLKLITAHAGQIQIILRFGLPGTAAWAEICLADEVGNTLLARDLIAWIIHFAGQEGPQLIQVGGMRGIAAMQTISAMLLALLEQAYQQTAGELQNSALATLVKALMSDLARLT
jgi:hypothetical protein